MGAAGRVRRAAAPTATALVLVGLVVLVLALVVVDADLADAGPSDTVLRSLAVAAVLAALAVGLTVLVGFRRRRTGVEAAPGAGSTLRAWAVLLGVVAAGLLACAVVRLVGQAGQGFAGTRSALTGVGSLAVLLGAAGLAVGAGVDARDRSGRTRVLAPVLAVVLVAALVAAALAVVPGWGLTSTTASGGGTRAGVPTSVSAVAWRTRLPVAAKDVVPAGPGAVVLLADGVVALDGRTGAVRWSYRRAHAKALRVDATPDGRTVLLQWQPGNAYGQLQLVALDGATGEQRWSDSTVSGSLTSSVAIARTNRVYVATGGEDTYVGVSLATGERVWRYRAPRGCTADGGTQPATATTTILAVVCPGEEPGPAGGPRAVSSVHFVGLRDSDRPVWTRRVRLSEPARSVTVVTRVPLDGSSYSASLSTQGSNLGEVGLDPKSGAVRPTVQRPGPGGSAVDYPEKAFRLRDRSGATVWRYPDPQACAAFTPIVLTSRGYGCLRSRTTYPGGRLSSLVRVRTGETARSVAVDLGGPFDLSRVGSDGATRLAAVPGSWVAVPILPPRRGAAAYAVGVR